MEESKGQHREPLASIKMLTYNHASFIRAAIDGVLQQQVKFPYELVIGEDCSTDGTREIVTEYMRRYPDIIRLVTSQENVGARRNGQRIHAACRGKYIAWCEGDDKWHDPLKLQKQVDFLEGHADYALVHSNYDLYYTSTRRKVARALRAKGECDENAYEEILTGSRCVLTVTALARRSALDTACAMPEYMDTRFLMGDLQVWLELSRLGKVGLLDEAMATHNMLEESVTHSKNPARELAFASSLRDLVVHYTYKYPCAPQAAAAAKASVCLFTLTKAWKLRDRLLAKRLFAEHRELAGRVSPHAALLLLGSQSAAMHLFSKPLITGYLWARSALL